MVLWDSRERFESERSRKKVATAILLGAVFGHADPIRMEFPANSNKLAPIQVRSSERATLSPRACLR